jgi:nucleoside-diphosphate-sugar epimerase
VFVSTVNVYSDNQTPDPGPDSPLVEAIEEDQDLKENPEAYGGMKVACERLVLEGTSRATVVRPGLIVGPGDPTGRYGYWPERLADGGTVLGPGDPADRVQIIDVRDLAEWIVRMVEAGTTGVYDGVGPATAVADVLAESPSGVGTSPGIEWPGQEFLTEQGVDPWMGPEALPLWLPRPDYDGMITHRFDLSEAAGLTVRSFADTARDTLAWMRENPDAARTGMTREREAEVLAAWKSRDS